MTKQELEKLLIDFVIENRYADQKFSNKIEIV